MIDYSKFKHFKKEEFTCKCGCGFNNMEFQIIKMLDDARDFAQIPFKINCGCRCEKHNKEVGGVEKSSHCDGLAVDISALSGAYKYMIVGSLFIVGFKRILIYDSFIHVDIDLSKVNPILKIMK